MNNQSLAMYILVMAGVTYLLRMLPMTLIKRKIRSRFIQSFIYYVPYAVLSAMTLPSILYSTDNLVTSAIGLIAAVTVALFGKSLLTVALTACSAVLLCEAVTFMISFIL